MNAMTISGGNSANLTMSSLEIADLTGKRHGDVIRDTRVMLDALGDDADLHHVRETKDSRGYTAEISLPKDLTLTLVAGYNVRLRKRIIDRWLELEAKVGAGGTAIPQTLPEALRLAADMAEQKAKAEAALAIAAPKAEALDRFANHDGKHNLCSATKVLGVQENKLKAWLLINRWYYRDHGGRLCAYADKIAAGYLDTIPVEIQRSDGVQVVPQPVITQKGLARLAELLARDGLLPKEAA